MPHAIADSDDDGDDSDIFIDEPDHDGNLALNSGSNEANAESTLQSYDGINARSTGSTGKEPANTDESH